MTPRPRGFAVCCALALVAGCSASRSPIFEWAPVGPLGGAAGDVQAGQTGAAGSSGVAGDPTSGTSGTGASGTNGESGTGSIDPNVRFEWTQTRPAPDRCAGGSFVGTFNCPVEDAPLPLAGTIFLSMVGPSEMQILESEIGILNVPLPGLVPDPMGLMGINTPVTGRAECIGRMFRGDIPEATLTAEQTGLLFSIATFLACSAGSTVTGQMVGQLAGDTVSGQIAMTIGSCSCSGTFELRASR